MAAPFWRLRRHPKEANSGTTFLLVLRHHFGEDDTPSVAPLKEVTRVLPALEQGDSRPPVSFCR
jgi:hypothetical protein